VLLGKVAAAVVPQKLETLMLLVMVVMDYNFLPHIGPQHQILVVLVQVLLGVGLAAVVAAAPRTLILPFLKEVLVVEVMVKKMEVLL
jgi:hypothetical protein